MTPEPLSAEDLRDIVIGLQRYRGRIAKAKASDWQLILDAARPVPAGALDKAWADAEAILPENWTLELSLIGHRYRAVAQYAYSLRHYRENVGRARWCPFEDGSGDTPVEALLALIGRLRLDLREWVR